MFRTPRECSIRSELSDGWEPTVQVGATVPRRGVSARARSDPRVWRDRVSLIRTERAQASRRVCAAALRPKDRAIATLALRSDAEMPLSPAIDEAPESKRDN